MNAFETMQHPLQKSAAGMADSSFQSTDSGSQKKGSMGSSMQAMKFADAMDSALTPTLNYQKPQKGLARAEDNDPNDAKGLNLTQIGQQFDRISQQLSPVVGDLTQGADFNQLFTGNKDQVVQELTQVQQGVNNLLDGNPNRFKGVTGVKLHTIANQITIEQNFIQQGGPNSAIGVRDVQRDILDIVNNDPRLTNASNRGNQQGFTPLSPLQNPSKPFQDNAAQTQYLNQTNQTLNSLVQQAQQFVKGKFAGDGNQLVQQIRTFNDGTSSFADSQGGLYSARFNNELGRNGTNNTAADQLIKGIEGQDKKLITAASKVLLANIGDVGANQLPDVGGTFSFAAANAGA